MASQTLEILIQAKLQTDKAFKDARSGLNKIGDAAERNRGKLLAVAGGVGAIGVASIKFASDLDEARNKSAVTFGEFGAQVEEFASTAATEFALSERAALEYSGTLGTILNASGLAAEASADMSVSMVKLASDLSSFNNIPIDQALEKLRSGIVGEAEPLRTMGILLSDAAMKAKALELGIGDASGALTEGEKVQARYALILEQTTNQQGDFGRTSESVANQMKIAQAQMENAAATLGTQLLPIATKVISAFSDLVGWFADLDETSQTVILVIGGVAGAVAALGLVLPPVIAGVGALNTAFLLLAANPIVAVIGGIVGGLVLLTTWYTNLKTDAELAAEGVEKVTLELQKFKEEMEVTGSSLYDFDRNVEASARVTIQAARDKQRANEEERDATIEAMQDIIDAQKSRVDSAIEASQGLSELFQRQREREQNITDWEVEQAALRAENAKQAWLDKREIWREESQFILDELARRASAAEKLQKEEFQAVMQMASVMRARTVIGGSGGGFGLGGMAPGFFNDFGANLVLNPTAGSDGKQDPYGINQAGNRVYFNTGRVEVIVEGSVVAEDLAATIEQGIQEVATRGGGWASWEEQNP